MCVKREGERRERRVTNAAGNSEWNLQLKPGHLKELRVLGPEHILV
jgi:hypothetical protein